MDVDQPEGVWGLAPVGLTEKALFNQAFAQLAQPISDYTFANVYIWRGAMKLYWARLADHLCVFANGDADLTLLLPPLPLPGAGDGQLAEAVGLAFEIMDAHNRDRPGNSRIEYVSDEMLERLREASCDHLQLQAEPMSGDYIYPQSQMVDLAGKSLKSKRHDRNRFAREHPDHQTRDLIDADVPACLDLLDQWRRFSDEHHREQTSEDSSHVPTQRLRDKEYAACRTALTHHQTLGLRSMTLWVGPVLVGFTLGESLSPLQASILFEKTLPGYDGAAQFIFSEFCRLYWPDHPEINVGDDWGIPTLRQAKQSYRPSRRLAKYTLARDPAALPPEHERIRRAVREDLSSILAIENACFEPDEAFTPRQLRDLLRNEHALCLVAERAGRVVGSCVSLVRGHPNGRSGRIYSLAVDPAHRGHGVGPMLLEASLGWLAEQQAGNVYLEVRLNNDVAKRLYERSGFGQVRILRDYYGPGDHGLSMRRSAIAAETEPLANAWNKGAECLGER